MKKLQRTLALTLSVVLLLAMLCACSDPGAEGSGDPSGNPSGNPSQTVEPTPEPKPADLAAFYALLAEAYHFPGMTNIAGEKEFLDNWYPGLSDISTEQLVVCTPNITSVATEIALVQVTNASDVNKVKEILQARIKTQADGGAWYPQTVDGWKNNSRVEVVGNYVMMIVHSHCDTIVSDFKAVIADPSFKPVEVPDENDSDGDSDDNPGGGVGGGGFVIPMPGGGGAGDGDSEGDNSESGGGVTPGFGGVTVPGFGVPTGTDGDTDDN